MSEQAEGQRTENNKISRRKLLKIGAAIAGTVAAERILPAAPASAETPTPTKAATTAPSKLPGTAVPVETAIANAQATAAAKETEIAPAQATLTQISADINALRRTPRPSATPTETGTPTPTRTSTSTPTATPTFTADQIRVGRRAKLLPPEPTVTEHPAERATPTPPGTSQTSGGIPWGTILGLGGLAILAIGGWFIGIRELIKSGILGRIKKGWEQPGEAATEGGEGTAGGTATAAGTGTTPPAPNQTVQGPTAGS